MPEPSHQSDPRILGRRTLERDHRALVQFLKPGLSVLDVGCGTGAITAGIARAVGPEGRVIGLDRDEGLLERARSAHAAVSNVDFRHGCATSLTFRAQFDIVTAARTLQWMAEPALAILKMKEAAKRSGVLVLLDYNHTNNEWKPEPPREFKLFYDSFLAWRECNGWDNQIGNRLPDLLRSAGLVDVRSYVQDEITERGDPDFADQTALWSDVIDTLGDRMAAAGFCTELQIAEARHHYTAWVSTSLVQQRLELRTVTGVVP
ncbi:MAG TPA: methyltransferase domain-containing protein [Bryobacteraceae bacterium]|nr:methyltransferase domain-containing protein [Bryobacteraceae bacterium]